MVLEKTLESLDSKEFNSVILQEINSVFIEKIDTEVLILWPPHANSQLIEKDPDARKY